jgi:hypothetical protein
MGHNLNLSHGAMQTGLDVNCKPNYVSIMNYGISGVGYSRNGFAGTILNPSSVSETLGLGTTDPQKIAHLSIGGFKYTVDPVTGAVDWNRTARFPRPMCGLD